MKKAIIGNFDELDYSGTEALNTICSNLVFSRRDLKKIVITSCAAGEGKSFLTMQIVQNLARRGKSVVLVDADLRRSYLIKRYNMETDEEWRGLAHYLAGYDDLDDVLYETDIENVYLIPTGRDVANPIQLLDSDHFGQLLDQLAARFEYVLVDAPPVGLVIDAAEIAKVCDGAVFVIEYNKTRRRDIIDARKQIMQAGCPVLGCIINKVTFDSLSAKKYYNKSYYSHYNSEYYRRGDKKSAKKDRTR